MDRFLALCLATVLLSSSASARQPETQGSLFDHLAGTWVLRGTIDDKQTTHDVDAELVLNRGYVRLHEVSRDKDANGAPAYEALVFISVDRTSGEYRMLWLDTTSNAGLSADGIGRGTPDGNSIPFAIKAGNGDLFHATFIYTPDSDTWRWVMDNESGGTSRPFARVTLTRRQ